MTNTEKTSITENNIKFYNEHATEFLQNTVNADMSEWRERFEKHLPTNGKILDAGCGSGRDSRAFMQDGFEVKAFDASEEMCRAAAALIGIEVRKMLFQEVDFCDEFDGIWACASLLHVEFDALPGVINKLRDAVKPGGVWYMSFKRGEFEGERDGRFFMDMNSVRFKEMFKNVTGWEIAEEWESEDVRRGKNVNWYNAVIRRSET